MDTPILYGKRIYLRRLTEDDASEDYVRWMNDPDINQYLESRFYTHTIESTKAFIRSVTNDNNYQFGIFDKEHDRHIGNIKVGGIEVDETTIQDIDTEIDWKLAEMKYELMNKK